MPKAQKKPCAAPGCPNLVERGQKYCEQHRSLQKQERSSASARGYGYQWQKARKRFLFSHTLCEECMKKGRYVKATDVDHVIPHRGDPKLFWDQSNWRALCHSCHSKKTNENDMDVEYRY